MEKLSVKWGICFKPGIPLSDVPLYFFGLATLKS